MPNKQRSREEIEESIAWKETTQESDPLRIFNGSQVGLANEIVIGLLLDIRDLLTEQSKKQRVEKPQEKPITCNICLDTGYVVEYEQVTEHKMQPVAKICQSLVHLPPSNACPN